ncbi:sulfurtransferase, partial [Micromonospora sp. b486]|nr:sulfurtransferase [Micromonospora sp. b486]
MSTSDITRPATLDAASLRELIDAGRARRACWTCVPGGVRDLAHPGSYNVPLDLLKEHREELRNHL